MRFTPPAALLSIILLAAPVVAAAEPPNPMATPAPTPGPKINTDLKVAPGILLRKTPKPVACPGAKSMAILLSSCSGAPGTQLTLTPTPGNTGIEVWAVQFMQNTAHLKVNAPATVGRSAGAYNTLTVPPLCPLEPGLGPSFSLVVSYYTSHPQGGPYGPTVTENLGTFTVICAPTSYGTSPPSAPQVMSCGGTTNPLTADHCGKTAGAPTMSGFTATCGASITITGNTFPAGSSDWLEFVVPASHATCKTSYYATPYVSVYISSSARILFDVYRDAAGTLVACGDGNCAGGVAAGVPGYAGLGTGTTGLPPGSYYIKIYGMTPSTVGTWTLKVSS